MVTITVPGDAYRHLNPNLRLFQGRTRSGRWYSELNARKQEWKGRVKLAWNQAGRPVFTVPVQIVVTLRRGRSVDPGNASQVAEVLVDGLKSRRDDPRCIPDDSEKWVKLILLSQETGPMWRGREEVVIQIAEDEGDDATEK